MSQTAANLTGLRYCCCRATGLITALLRYIGLGDFIIRRNPREIREWKKIYQCLPYFNNLCHVKTNNRLLTTSTHYYCCIHTKTFICQSDLRENVFLHFQHASSMLIIDSYNISKFKYSPSNFWHCVLKSKWISQNSVEIHTAEPFKMIKASRDKVIPWKRSFPVDDEIPWNPRTFVTTTECLNNLFRDGRFRSLACRWHWFDGMV